jgi:hypothetical protein
VASRAPWRLYAGGLDIQVNAGGQAKVAGAQVEVAPGVDNGVAALAAVGDDPGDQVDIASGCCDQGAARCDRAAYVVEVASGGDGNGIARDAPAQVVHIVCCEADDTAPGDGATVGEVTGEVQVDGAAGEQRAAGGQVAILDADVDLGHQGLLPGVAKVAGRYQTHSRLRPSNMGWRPI